MSLRQVTFGSNTNSDLQHNPLFNEQKFCGFLGFCPGHARVKCCCM